MKIKDAILDYCNARPNYGFTIPTDEEGYLNVNIQFINSNGREDETQMDVLPAYFDYGAGKCHEIELLWKEFCKENKFYQNSVTAVYIVGGW